MITCSECLYWKDGVPGVCRLYPQHLKTIGTHGCHKGSQRPKAEKKPMPQVVASPAADEVSKPVKRATRARRKK
jgi:hypothetical protein